jgi:hypothetical protein
MEKPELIADDKKSTKKIKLEIKRLDISHIRVKGYSCAHTN